MTVSESASRDTPPNGTDAIIPRVYQGVAFVWDLVVHPATAFRRIRSVSAWTVFKWYLGALAVYTTSVTTLAYTGLAVTVTPSWLEVILGYPRVYPSMYPIPIWLICIIGCYVGTMLCISLIPEITIRAVFGRESSRGVGQSFKAVAISVIPILLFGWIPIVGTIVGVPMILYEVIGIRELHQISTRNAIVAVLLWPALLLCVIIGLLLTVAVATLLYG